MDFARRHEHQESVTTRSRIRHIPLDTTTSNTDTPGTESTATAKITTLDDMIIAAGNRVAADLLVEAKRDPKKVNSALYTDRVLPKSETIQPNDLVVIFESFDNLNFCYAKPGEIFSNRNGHFHHQDFIGKPYGCKVRSRDNKGYGYMYLLRPTPELWARSLNHRTQIIHELDASMIVYYLNLRPNMVVCESGTGSGALSHCILRTIAPHGRLHTFEFNQVRAEAARKEFEKNRVDHLVTVHHKDVCGKREDSLGGFDQPQASVDAVTLDLPEPWHAVPHAAYCLKPNARIASYSPCVEQSQRTIVAMKQAGFHSITTMEFRLREHYVDEVEYELAPREKRPRTVGNPYVADESEDVAVDEENTGEEAERSDQDATDHCQATRIPGETSPDKLDGDVSVDCEVKSESPPTQSQTVKEGTSSVGTTKRKKMLVARPFGTMKGHTAFLTFASAGNKKQPDANLQIVSNSVKKDEPI